MVTFKQRRQFQNIADEFGVVLEDVAETGSSHIKLTMRDEVTLRRRFFIASCSPSCFHAPQNLRREVRKWLRRVGVLR